MNKMISISLCDFCGKPIKEIGEEYFLVQFRKKGEQQYGVKCYCKNCFDYNKADSLRRFKGIQNETNQEK